MSLFTRLFGGRFRAPEAKASRAFRLLSLYSGGRAVWSPRDMAALAREGYAGNPVVHRAVRLVAEQAASIGLVAFEGGRELDRHPLLDLLAAPNRRAGGREFLEALYAHLLISGNAYLEAAAVDGQIRELHTLRPDRMKVVPGADGWPVAYDYSVGTETVRFHQDGPVPPVLHLTLFHPLDDHYGLSPLDAAAQSLDLHNAAAAWNKALLDNAARPSGALVYEGQGGVGLGQDQFERLKSELEAGFQGAANAGRPLLLEGGLSWQPLSLSPKDMDFIEARAMAAREIVLAFGVPPMLLGIPGDNTYSNLAEANRALWRHTVLPLAAKVTRSLTAWLRPAFGAPDLALELDLDQVPALSQDRESLWRRVEAASFLTLNEKRAALGYGPVEGGDEPGRAGVRA